MFEKSSRRFLAVIAILVATICGAASTAWAGSGYPPCGDKCDAQDPAGYVIALPDRPGHYTCSIDAVTPVGQLTLYGRTIQLRYSNRCETVWGRVFGVHQDDTIRIQTWNGDQWITKYEWVRQYQKVTDTYTGMWNDHDRTDRVCFEPNDQLPQDPNNCTAGY